MTPEEWWSLTENNVRSLEGFLDTHSRYSPAHYPGGWNLKGMPTIEELDDLLAFSLLRHPFVRMYNTQGRVPISSLTTSLDVYGELYPGYFNYEAARKSFSSGFAIELGAVHLWFPPFARIARVLSELVGAEVDAQVFITPPGVQGLPVHRDPADGFAIHLHGTKRWRVYERPNQGGWARGAIDGSAGALLVDVVMEPGDVLYFPGGCAHEVVAADEAVAVHVTFGMRHPSAEDMFEVIGRYAWSDADEVHSPLEAPQLSDQMNADVIRIQDVVSNLSPEALVSATQDHLSRLARDRPGFLANLRKDDTDD